MNISLEDATEAERGSNLFVTQSMHYFGVWPAAERVARFCPPSGTVDYDVPANHWQAIEPDQSDESHSTTASHHNESFESVSGNQIKVFSFPNWLLHEFGERFQLKPSGNDGQKELWLEYDQEFHAEVISYLKFIRVPLPSDCAVDVHIAPAHSPSRKDRLRTIYTTMDFSRDQADHDESIKLAHVDAMMNFGNCQSFVFFSHAPSAPQRQSSHPHQEQNSRLAATEAETSSNQESTCNWHNMLRLILNPGEGVFLGNDTEIIEVAAVRMGHSTTQLRLGPTTFRR